MADIFTGTGAPVSRAAYDNALKALETQADPAALWAILAVETRGFGFLPDRRPKILFERHVFHERTGGKFSAAHPDVSNEATGGYGGGAAEYPRLTRAMALDRDAALQSASWGLGQIMGFNAGSIGYPSAQAMVDAFKGGEDAQLAGCVDFITGKPALSKAFKARKWATVALFYNGENFAKNGYDVKLAQFHARYQTGLPDIEVRADQARLAFLGFDPKGVDGVAGPGTVKAIRAFQAARGLPSTGTFDAATRPKLRAAAGV